MNQRSSTALTNVQTHLSLARTSQGQAAESHLRAALAALGPLDQADKENLRKLIAGALRQAWSMAGRNAQITGALNKLNELRTAARSAQ